MEMERENKNTWTLILVGVVGMCMYKGKNVCISLSGRKSNTKASVCIGNSFHRHLGIFINIYTIFPSFPGCNELTRKGQVVVGSATVLYMLITPSLHPLPFTRDTMPSNMQMVWIIS